MIENTVISTEDNENVESQKSSIPPNIKEQTDCEEDALESVDFDEPTISKGEKYITIINNNKTVNMYGDNPNLINADNIENSNIQSRSATIDYQKSDISKTIQLNDEHSFERYVNKFKNTKTFFALIAVASLEIIEETQFEFICNELKGFLDVVIQPVEQEQSLDTAFESRMFLYDNAFLVKTVAKRNTHAGLINTKCLSFSDKSLAEKVRVWVWDLYPQFRNAVIDWLIALNSLDKWFICTTAQNAIAEYSKIDFEYTLQTVFPKLYRKTNEAKIATLSFVIEKLYEKGMYEKNIEKLLLGWFGTINNDLWMVGFRLYAKGYVKNCKEKMYDVLYSHIFDPLFRKDKDFLYIMGFAHRSKHISNLLIDVISESFNNQRIKVGRDEIAKIFIWLVLYDFFTTDENYPLLVFADYANESDLRKRMRPILHHILNNYQMRSRLLEILNAFIIVYDEKSIKYTSIEKFIRELAFTGKKEDYERIVLWLSKNEKNENTSRFSRHMLKYLNGFLLNK